MNRSGTWVKQSGGFKAFIPSPLPPIPPINIDGDLKDLIEEAKTALAILQAFSKNYGINIDLLIAMYVKKEALLSAQIEGTQASLEDIFEYEQGEKPENINDIEEVVNYIKALNYGIKRLETLPMSLRLIKELHKILLSGVRGAEKTPGEFRRSQNWIGPGGGGLKEATFVPPPVHEMTQAMSDLEHYLYQENGLPDVVKCALIHYQFETIHPFLDGNGRLGRLLITLYFNWKDVLEKPILYMSYYLKKNRQEYYDRLNLVRNKGDYEQWIEFFLKGINITAHAALDDAKKIHNLHERHRQLLWQKKVSSAYAYRLLDRLFYKPIMSITHAQEELDLSYPTAAKLVSEFESLGILKEITGKKREKKFAFTDYLAILSEGSKPL